VDCKSAGLELGLESYHVDRCWWVLLLATGC